MAVPPPRDYRSIAPRPAETGPIDSAVLLPGPGPLEVDVGFGRGHSLLERARVAPEARLLGIEIKTKWAFRVAARVQRDGLSPRVHVFAADAKDVLARLEPAGCVTRVSVHFPDPWWKKRHRKRRVVGSDFLDILARVLAPAGELYVQTDVEERADEYAADIAAHPAFGSVERLAENPFGARSNRELRAAEDGLPVYRLLSRRTA